MGSHESPSGRIGSWRYVGGIPVGYPWLWWDETTICDMGMGQNPGTPGEPQNSWDLWMFITLKMVLIGIDP